MGRQSYRKSISKTCKNSSSLPSHQESPANKVLRTTYNRHDDPSKTDNKCSSFHHDVTQLRRQCNEAFHMRKVINREISSLANVPINEQKWTSRCLPAVGALGMSSSGRNAVTPSNVNTSNCNLHHGNITPRHIRVNIKELVLSDPKLAKSEMVMSRLIKCKKKTEAEMSDVRNAHGAISKSNAVMERQYSGKVASGNAVLLLQATNSKDSGINLKISSPGRSKNGRLLQTAKESVINFKIVSLQRIKNETDVETSNSKESVGNSKTPSLQRTKVGALSQTVHRKDNVRNSKTNSIRRSNNETRVKTINSKDSVVSSMIISPRLSKTRRVSRTSDSKDRVIHSKAPSSKRSKIEKLLKTYKVQRENWPMAELDKFKKRKSSKSMKTVSLESTLVREKRSTLDTRHTKKHKRAKKVPPKLMLPQSTQTSGNALAKMVNRTTQWSGTDATYKASSCTSSESTSLDERLAKGVKSDCALLEADAKNGNEEENQKLSVLQRGMLYLRRTLAGWSPPDKTDASCSNTNLLLYDTNKLEERLHKVSDRYKEDVEVHEMFSSLKKLEIKQMK